MAKGYDRWQFETTDAGVRVSCRRSGGGRSNALLRRRVIPYAADGSWDLDAVANYIEETKTALQPSVAGASRKLEDVNG